MKHKLFLNIYIGFVHENSLLFTYQKCLYTIKKKKTVKYKSDKNILEVKKEIQNVFT